MRTIKLGAWLRKEHIMLTVYVLDQTIKASTGCHYKTSKGFDKDGKSIVFNIDEVELMQFTGLLDRNRNEIFEGDILKYPFGYTPEEQAEYTDKVTFEDGTFNLDGVPLSLGVPDNIADTVDCLIIGNIYEPDKIHERGNTIQLIKIKDAESPI